MESRYRKKSIIIFISLIFLFEYRSLKIAICTMAKNENLYIRQFIGYYEKQGIDNIFIYDDNDNNIERIKDIIPLNKKTKVIVFENIKKSIKKQPDAFTKCYNNNNKKFDWFLMIDIDEYLIIKNSTIKQYLSSSFLKKCDFIKVHWIIPNDNNLIYYDNRTLFERFPGPFKKSSFIKTIIRGNIDGLKYWVHSPIISPYKNITCDNTGQIINYTNMNFQQILKFNSEKAFFIHFKYKSAEEYLNKIRRGYSNWAKMNLSLNTYLREFFKINVINKEKIEYFEKKLNLSLKDYRKRLKAKIK